MTTSLAFQPDDWSQPLPRDPREIVEVCVSDLFVDRNAQREVNPERVARIANEFEWNRFEMPTCTRLADGTLRVDEGQHRVLGLRKRDPNAMVRALVTAGSMTIGDESGLALAIATNRATHAALEKWELRLRKGCEHEIRAEEVLRRHGLRLGKGASPTSIACVSTVEQLIHADRQSPEAGADTLDMVISVIEKAYPRDEPDSSTTRWNRDLVRAIGTLVRRNPNLKPPKLIAVLRDRIAQQWIAHGTALADRSTWLVIAEAVAQRYNKGLRSDRAKIGL